MYNNYSEMYIAITGGLYDLYVQKKQKVDNKNTYTYESCSSPYYSQ